MALKTYVLTEATEASAPVYQRINENQRVRLQKRPFDQPYLQITFQEKEGEEGKPPRNRTIRLKFNCNSIYQDVQIKEEQVPANTPFTQAEREAVQFINGILVTKYEIVQKFLDAHPQNESFKGFCEHVAYPMFREYKINDTIASTNSELKKRVKAANKILALDLKEGQDLMIKINGKFFKVPGIDARTQEEKEAATQQIQNDLMDWMDNTDEDGLDRILEDKITQDDEILIVVGKAYAKGILEFSKNPNQVSMLKSGNWIDVKMIPSEMTSQERERFFLQFLSSSEGKLLFEDLKKEVEAAPKKNLSK